MSPNTLPTVIENIPVGFTWYFTNPESESSVPPDAFINPSKAEVGIMMRVVPVSTIADAPLISILLP